MFHRSQRIILAALMVLAPLAAGAAASHKPPVPAKSHKKVAKPAAKKPKAGVKTASRPYSPPGMAHRPPAPPASYSRSHFEIPQAKSLADTPDVVTNSRVRAALMAALSVPNQEEITPTTTKGVVTLAGSVKSKALRARAEQAARKVHGVRAVKNELVVK